MNREDFELGMTIAGPTDEAHRLHALWTGCGVKKHKSNGTLFKCLERHDVEITEDLLERIGYDYAPRTDIEMDETTRVIRSQPQIQPMTRPKQGVKATIAPLMPVVESKFNEVALDLAQEIMPDPSEAALVKRYLIDGARSEEERHRVTESLLRLGGAGVIYGALGIKELWKILKK